MRDWPVRTLDQLGTVERGKSRHRPRNDPVLYGGEYPFFQTGDVKAAEFYLSDHNQTYNEVGLAQSRLWEAGTLCITIAANIAESAVLAIPACFPDSVVGFIPADDVADVRFVKYLLDHTKLRMQAISRGTTQDNLSLDKLLSLDFSVPSLGSQQKIATVLAAYDESIENNLRRIEILEEMAQAVYREWFVNFRFPGHEDVALVDSLLGPIPQGWQVLSLEDVIDTLESGSRPRGGIDPDERAVPSVGAENVLGLGRYDFSKEKYISRDFFESMRRGHVEPGDVLLYKDGAKLGRKSLFRDGFPHKECAINEHVFLLRTNGVVSQSFLYFWLDLQVNTQRIIDLNSNAAQPGINQSKVLGLSILSPSGEVVARFDQLVEPMLALLFNLARQNTTLRETRDLLLPKLVSGEIDVSDLDIDTEWLAS